jgi:hypothetical protein
MAREEGPCGKSEAATPSSTGLRTEYRAARARLMGRVVPPPAPAATADAAPKISAMRVSGPACWLAELVAFNEELRRLFIGGAGKMATASGERIRAVVAEHYGLSLAEICGDRSTRRCAWPRQIAMYICARQAALSTPSIAQLFGGRDPSTVLYALRAVTARAAKEPALKREISALIRKCRVGGRA